VWRNPLHASASDPQFLAEHGNLRFELMDPRVFRIPILDQGFAPCEHRDADDAQDIEHCGANERVPVLGKSQGLELLRDFGGHGGDRKSRNITSRRWQSASRLA
jgi:hypothetical protein